jgi:hypothetical protein
MEEAPGLTAGAKAEHRRCLIDPFKGSFLQRLT